MMEGNNRSEKKSLKRNLDMQRMLALKTISRADEKPASQNQSMSISYLLRPSESHTTIEDSVSMNPSDIFNISDITPNIDLSNSSASNINLSQSVQEILAASCLKDVQDSVSELEDINKKCPTEEIAKDIWSKSINFESMQNSWAGNQQSFQDLNDAEFISFNNNIQQRLLSDEKEWRQQFADIPQEVNKLNFSEFSGYLPSSSICNRIKIDESCKSFGEYFQGGSENLNDMIPNRTPRKSKPVAIVNMVNIDTPLKQKCEKQNSFLSKAATNKSNDATLPVKDSTSVASISTISRALNAINENDSPQTIISTMLKKASRLSKQTEKDVDEFIEIHSDNSIISGSIGSKSNKENTDPNIIYSASSSTLNSTADFIALTENFATDLAHIIPTINLVTSSHLEHDKKTDTKRSAIKNINSVIKNIKSVKGNNNKLGSWIEPENLNKYSQPFIGRNINKTVSQPEVKEKDNANCKIDKAYLNMKFEESVIIIQDDSNTSLQDLDITVKGNDVANLPLWCPLFLPLKLHSKSQKELCINAQFMALEIDKKKMISNAKDFIKIELPTNPIYLKPYAENELTVKVWGFAEGQMNVTLLLEGHEENSQDRKSLQHTFEINFMKPAISICLAESTKTIDLIEFGSLPKSSSKTIDLIFINHSKISLPLKLKLNSAQEDIFSLICNEDDSFIKSEVQLELHETISCGIKFETGSENGKEIVSYIAALDVGLYVNEEFVLLKSCKITGLELYSHVLFDSESYPLRLEYGETRPATILNVGDIDLSFDVHVGYDMDATNPCTDDIFTISQNKISVKKGEHNTLQVALTQELLSSTERVLIFQQSLYGPVYYWPLIGKSRSVQHYLKNFLSPTNMSKKLDKRSASPQNSNKLDSKREKSPNKTSPSKIDYLKSNLKIAHNRISPVKDFRSSYGSASTGSELSSIDRLPIKSIKTKMSWPSVQVGKNMLQDVTIKNVSEHRMKVNIEISNKAFSLVNNKDVSSSMSLLLHGYEVRSFSVVFSPRKTGLHVGSLTFTNNNPKAKSTIPLVGFGGISDVSITGVFKVPNGTNILSLGKFSTANTIQESITLFNKGTVPAFALVLCDNFKPNFLLSEIIATPSIMIVQPNTYKTIDISFRPGKYDMSHVKEEVLELAKVSIVSGDEGLRQRARQLYYSNPAQKNDNIWKKILPLLTNIDGEPSYTDMCQINESPSALYDILAPLTFKEISVTIEKHSQRISDMSAITIDESLMFQSLCIEDESVNDSMMETWSFEPSKIVFSLSCLQTEIIKITSSYDCMQSFQVTAHPWFRIKPMSGMLAQKECVEISILYIGGPLRKKQSTSIQVLADNDVLNIPIEINISM